MNVAVRLVLLAIATGLVVGAALLTAWLLVLLVVVAWRLAGVGLRSLGWSAVSQRSEAACARFVSFVSRFGPIPDSPRISRGETLVPPHPPN